MLGKIWTPIDFPFLGADLPTTQICEIPQSSWPAWAVGSRQFTGFWVHLPTSTEYKATMTTAAVIAKLITERYDHKDEAPWNYNYHLIARTTDGNYLQSGPLKTTDIDHHSSAPTSALPRRPTT
jgi:hypothetical protein